jgi:hypothetical protein
MARFAAGWRSTGAGSTTLPIAGLMAQASTPLWLVEVGITNTAAVAFSCSLRRILTGAGTPGAAQTVNYEESDTVTAKGDPRDTWTVTPTAFGAGSVRNTVIGASIGSGIIWTFGGRGLFIPAATTNGIAIIPFTGAGQISDVYFSWDA